VNVLELTRLGANHVRNAIAEEIYLRTGRDMTVPVSIYGEVAERCNYKCRYCEYWRRPHYREEMSIEDWKKALLDRAVMVWDCTASGKAPNSFLESWTCWTWSKRAFAAAVRARAALS
jgi:hypothetical protein